MLFYSSLLTILLSIILVVFNWKVNKSVIYLSFFFVAFAVYGLSHHFTIYSNSPFWLAVFYNHFAPFYLLPGPLLFFYTKESLTDTKAFSQWTDYLHFIPAVINLIAIAPYFFVPFNEKVILANEILNNFEAIKTSKVNWLYPPMVGFMIRPLLMLGYGLWLGIKLLRFKPKKEVLERIPVQQYSFVKKWILLLCIISCMASAGFLALTTNLIQQEISKTLINAMPLHFGVGIIFCLLPVTLFLFPKILYGMPVSTVNEKQNKSVTRKQNNSATVEDPFLSLSNDILAYIAKERPFVNATFSMSHIAVIFNVPQHHVAYCFNHVLNKKFTDLRTEFRVNYAKELLSQGLAKTLSMDGIGVKAGFATRSNFYSSFKALTGLTPSEYLEQKGS